MSFFRFSHDDVQFTPRMLVFRVADPGADDPDPGGDDPDQDPTYFRHAMIYHALFSFNTKVNISDILTG